MLTVHQGNRLEDLAERLAAVLGRALAAPLAGEEIVVQNPGMARWLSLELAKRLGVLANARFRLPAEFVWMVFERVLRDVPRRSSYDPAVLQWRVLKELGAAGAAESFPTLQAYLAPGDDRRAYELSQRLAGLFDQYQVYRPDWIRDWERGSGDHWQAHLWRRLLQSGERGGHWVGMLDRFVAAMEHDEPLGEKLPERVALFGLASLSPTYLAVLQALGKRIDVHLFVLNPCREYWGDLVAERDLARYPAQARQSLHLESGNSLLASLGKQGREFIDLLQELGGAETDTFVEPDAGYLLQELQRDILNLHERGAAGQARTVLAAGDRSLQVHACHGPMREAEVLHDQLLQLFADNRDLRACDVLIMTPDIEQYAPYIEAVFSSARDERYIPFSIADRPAAAQSPVTAAFLALLELRDSRCDADSIAGLLEVGAIRHRFGFATDDLPLVHRWIRAAGIRWGMDARHRERLGLPATAEHSWRQGLDRLLLGLAMPEQGQLFDTVLPYEVDGGEAEVLGQVCEFAEAVFDAGARLRGRWSLARWVEELQRLLERFFEPTEEHEVELQVMRSAIEDMGEQAQCAGFDRPVSLAVVQAHLEHRFAAPGARFLRGGVTFCAMVPMRSIPHEVVGLLGMNYDAVPRAHRPLSFDRMAKGYRRGDRSRRDDDRYLFLETLLCARRCLYISYVGQSIRDNSTIPPSVLVSELLDYVEQGFATDTGVPVTEALVVKHPLQPFSPRYFEGGESLFSYSAELCEASRASRSERAMAAPLLVTPLPTADTPWREVDADRLVAFFAHPVRFLLRERLGIRLEQKGGLLETHEPFALDWGARRRMRELLLHSRLHGDSSEQATALARGAGLLPHGEVGRLLAEGEDRVVGPIAERLGRYLPRCTQALSVDLVFSNVRITGRLADVGTEGLLEYRLIDVGPVDWVGLWIRHLVLNCVAPEGVGRTSRLVYEKQETVLAPVADAEALLAEFAELYWRGLHRPLHFFPRSAYQYVAAKANNDEAARRIWVGGDFSAGEGDNPYYQLAFRGAEALDDAFRDVSRQVFEPFLLHQEKV